MMVIHQQPLHLEKLYIISKMDYNRFTIDLIKSSFAQYVSTGTINESELDNGISLISKAIDKALIANEETTVLEGLKSDLQHIRYELL